MNASGPRRLPPDQFSGSGHTLGTARQPHTGLMYPVPSKRVCFYKSGDQQFNGLRMVINSRTFKSFDALLDSLSKKVPLPFGVRNITTPRGLHAVRTVEELEDGMSYICSDTRKMKPINLALARRKLPPWYSARPGSPRHRVARQARAGAVRAPKRLVVFRNGDPSIRHVVILQKRATTTFQSLLNHVSELMQFHVVKLHTIDGRRVDGLPALILSSGTVVAAGKEPFKPGNYNTFKSPAPTWPPANQTSSRRPKKAQGKKKYVAGASESRHFSTSSERYFVNQMQTSITGSYGDFPSNITDSVELEGGQAPESLAETDTCCCGNVTEGKSSCLPTDDDIEKSFRVNQDGSMTVEMRVRLTLKEEETIHWTTTLTRSGVAKQRGTLSLSADEQQPQVEQEKTSPESGYPEAKDSTTSRDTVKRNKSKDDDEDMQSLEWNGIASEDGTEVDNSKKQMADVCPRRATPGPVELSKKQASEESVKSLRAEEIQPGMVSSYVYSGQTDNVPLTERYCMVRRSSSRPVPKPRQLVSVEIRNNGDQSELQTSGMSEILQIQDSRQEVTETVLHILEQQTCQENFLENSHFSAQGVSMYGVHYSRPATSDSAGLSPSGGFDCELLRPSESRSMWQGGNMSTDLTIPSPHTRPLLQNKGKDSLDSHEKAVKGAKIISSKPKRMKKQFNRIMSPTKKHNQSTTDAPQKCKKEKQISSARHLKRIYGYKPKTAMGVVNKLKKKQTTKYNGDDTTKILAVPCDTLKIAIKEGSENMNDVSLPKLTQSNGVFDCHKNEENLCADQPSVCFCQINPGRTAINDYVGLPEKANPQSVYPNQGTVKVKQVNQIGTAVGKSKVYPDEKTEEMEPRTSEGENYTQSCLTDQNKISVQDSLARRKLKDRIRSLEKTLQPGPSLQKSHSVEKPAAQSSLENKTPGEKHCLSDTYSAASSPLYRLSSSSSLMSEDRLLSISPTSDHVPTPTEHTVEQTTPTQANMASATEELALTRNPPVKRARLVSNLSFERKMSVRKACVEKNTSIKDVSLEPAIASTRKCAIENKTVSSVEMQTFEKVTEETPQSNNSIDLDSPCMSASPIRLIAEERASSHEHPSPIKQIQIIKDPPDITTQSNISSTKPAMKNVKLTNYISLENKLSSRTSPSERKKQRDNSLKSTSSYYTDPTSSTNSERRKTDAQQSNTSPEMPSKAFLQNRQSPYSQPLDEMSPSIQPKSKNQSISKNLSLDNTQEAISQTPRKPESKTKKELRPPPQWKGLSSSAEDPPELENREMCNAVRPSEEIGSKQRNLKNVGVTVSAKESIGRLEAEELSSSVEFKCSELKCNKNPVFISTSESIAERPPSISNLMGLNVISDESISGPDVAEQATLEENHMTERLQLKSLSLSGPKDDLENYINDQTDQKVSKQRMKIHGSKEHSRNLTEEHGVNVKKQLHHNDSLNYESQNIRLKDLIESQDSHTTKAQPKPYSYDVDEDSGNDVQSCGEHGEEQFKAEEEHSSSTETGLSAEKDETGSKGKPSRAVKELKRQYDEETRLQPVAERIRSLERQAAGTHQRRNTVETSTIKQLGKTTPVTPTMSDDGDVTSETHKSHSALCTRSAPQSSLSFSYDSSNIVTREPKANRVKTIREMFQVKSVADITHELRGFPTPSTSELLVVRPETSDSGGYQTQASSELSGGEDDLSWKAITQGFVKRTIERLYGKKDFSIDEEAGQITPSASKPKKHAESSSILSHFQAARSSVSSDVSYFSSTNTLDTLTETKRCVAFNTQVVPTDSAHADQGGWLHGESTLIRKSTSDPTGINKTCATSLEDEDNKDAVPCSPLSTKAQLEEKPRPAKCTYFSLHHASDSDACQDDQSIGSVNNCERVSESKDDPKETKRQLSNRSTLPFLIPTGFKIVDNKVHPLRQTSPGGEVVVVQPGKGHVVHRRPQETDVLDLIYTFCGQHCPIL